MSRRARRRKSAGNAAGGGKPWAGRLLVIFVVAVLALVGLGYLSLRIYLHSDGFRKFLSAQVSKAAGVRGDFAPFLWDGLAVETQSFDADGEGRVAALRADVVMTEVGFGGIRRGVWELQDTRISRLDVTLRRKSEGLVAPPPPPPAAPAKPKQSPWLPSEVEIRSVDIGDVSLRAELPEGPATLSGATLYIEPAPGRHAYRMDLSGGQVRFPQDWTPELRIGKVSGTYRDGHAYLNRASVSAWSEGRIEAQGEMDIKDGLYSFGGTVAGLKCEELLDETWARRLNGDIDSTFRIDNHGGGMAMAGDLNIRGGTLTALPMLDALAAYADTRRFRILNLNEARTKWRWKKGEIILTDFAMASEGLVRLEGGITIRGEELDGRFRLGLAPGTLSNIPGAETHVFQAGERGLLWTNLHLTGTLSDPKEDLTDRLVDAAGMRMFEMIPETGEQALKFTRSMLGESPKIIDEGVKIIEKGSDVVRDATGILDGFFGTRPAPVPVPVPVPEEE